jgi:hypothetical protein
MPKGLAEASQIFFGDHVLPKLLNCEEYCRIELTSKNMDIFLSFISYERAIELTSRNMDIIFTKTIQN